MGAYKLPAKVKLVMGLLGANREILKRTRVILGERFGAGGRGHGPHPLHLDPLLLR